MAATIGGPAIVGTTGSLLNPDVSLDTGLRNASVERLSIIPTTNDYEALRAAALAGLGRNRDRMILLPKDGELEVLDVRRLDRHKQRDLLQKAMDGGSDNQGNRALFDKLAARLEKVGLRHPEITLRYRNLTVSTSMVVGDRSVPTLTGEVKRSFEPVGRLLGRASPRTRFPIIDDVSGMVKPGVFTLLLGPPGSGKTTLLQALSGRLRKTPGLHVQAEELTFNGYSFDEFVVERSAAYVSQNDVHYGELTVRETMDFSARCLSSGYKQELIEEIAKREEELGIEPDPVLDAFSKATAYGTKSNIIVELIIKLLGLDVCADTIVGNAMMRGISGGQKKRVTTAEMMVGPAKLLCADEISTGLDSNTTYQITLAFRNATHMLRSTMIIGLLQPQPEVFDLFDDVILIGNGKVCFHGPREMVLPFFETLGFECPERRGVADFLQEVATPTDQAKYWALEKMGKPHRYVTAKMVEKEFGQTEHGRFVWAELAQPFDKSRVGPLDLTFTKWGPPRLSLLRANFWRTWVQTKRTQIMVVIRMLQAFIMAFVVSTLYWREDKNTVADGNLFFAVIFYSVLYLFLSGIPEMHLMVDRLAVMFKQRDQRFYPGWCFALPCFIMRIPFGIIEATLWTNLVYWIVGFSPSVRYLMFWFQLILCNLWSVSLFQTIAAVMRDNTTATAVGSFFLLVLINLTGFILSKNKIPAWWLGGYWANPYAYITKALAINEFTSGHWQRPDPINGGLLGPNILASHSFPSEYWWCWVSIGFVVGTMCVNVCLLIMACTFLGAPKRRAVISEEALSEHAVARRSVLSSDDSMTGDVEKGLAQPPAGEHAEDVKMQHNQVFQADQARGAADAEPAGGKALDDTAAGQGLEAQHPDAVARLHSVDAPASPHSELMLSASQRMSRASQQAVKYKSRTALAFDPMVMTFRDVEYSVPLPKDADREKANIPQEGPHAGNLRLLSHINGAFRPQVLTALMGASGAGKTTLMDVLAGRKTGGVITGDVRVNGQPKDQAVFSRVMGYVEQTDIHLPQATVHEALAFSAELRLPTSVDAETRNQFVEEVMALVELDRLRHGYVGVPGVSGLSVEQRKRLTLAVELVANPSVVFMDEPTSGLDARAAGIVMGAIRNTVDTGRTVVCTIHQPSLDIFEAFDELLLLKPGGRTIFFGPMGDNSDGLISYFESIPGVEPIKPRYNPATWMLEESNPGAEAELGVDFADVYAKSELAKEMDKVISEAEQPDPERFKPLELGHMQAPGTMTQFKLCLKRNFLMYWRAPEFNITRFAITMLVAFSFGSMFWRQGNNRTTVQGVLNIMGVLYSSCLFMGVSNCLTIQPHISVQRTVYYRERAAGMYGVMPFVAAQQIVELPYLVIQAILYSAIVYWMVWFDRDAGKFFWFFFLFFLTLLFFTYFGIASVNMTPNLVLSNVFSSFLFGFWNLFSGFLIQEPLIPGWWVWAYWTNPVAWELYGLIITQLGSFKDTYITDLNNQVVTIPEFLKEFFFYKTWYIGPCLAMNFAFIAICSAGATFALKYLNYQRR